MSQLTQENEDTLRYINYNGKVTPKQFEELINTIIPRVLRDYEYARNFPDRPLDDIVPKD